MKEREIVVLAGSGSADRMRRADLHELQTADMSMSVLFYTPKWTVTPAHQTIAVKMLLFDHCIRSISTGQLSKHTLTLKINQ